MLRPDQVFPSSADLALLLASGGRLCFALPQPDASIPDGVTQLSHATHPAGLQLFFLNDPERKEAGSACKETPGEAAKGG